MLMTLIGFATRTAGAISIGSIAGAEVHAIDLVLQMSSDGASVRLPPALHEALPDIHYAVAVPGPDAPLRIAFATCNGAEDVDKAARMPGGRNAMWTRLTARHNAEPFHLPVMGGEQI